MNQPKEYAQARDIQYRDIEDLIKDFPEVFQSMKGHIMDIGCGPGNITRDRILPAVPKEAVIVGTDRCPLMIEYANEHCAIKDRLSFAQLDIQTSALTESMIGQFDHAISLNCLQWCRNVKLALENIYNLFRPGGQAIILTIAHHMVYDVYADQHDDPRFAPYMQDWKEFTPPQNGHVDGEERMRKDLADVRFTIEHCANKWTSLTYPDLKTFVDAMLAVNPFVKRLSPELQAEYREDFGRRLRDDYLPKKIYESDDSTVECRLLLLIAVFKKPQNEC